MPQVCDFSTDLISPPMAIEKAAPISGRKAQLETSSVCFQSKPGSPHPASLGYRLRHSPALRAGRPA